jgi:membrane protein
LRPDQEWQLRHVAEAQTRSPAQGRRAPDDPTDLPSRSWGATFKRAVREFREDNIQDFAAALTYYGVLSLFPALLVLVSLLGLLGDSTTQPLIDNLTALAPGSARDILTNAITNLQNAQTSGLAFVAGLAGALWSASGYIGAFIRASNEIYEIQEGRPFWKLRPLQIVVTVLLILVLAAISLSVVVTGPLARRVGDVVGVGDTAVTVWNIAKWPVILLVVSQAIAFLYWVTPNVKQPGYRWLSPGGILAVVLWVIASAVFAFYVSRFGSYNKTYGSLAGVAIFLIWLWITNLVILLGAEVNAEVERSAAIEGGMRPPDKEPFLEPRDKPKED